MTVSDDRWSCSQCNRTVVIYGTAEDVAAAIAAVQTRHYKAHREAANLSARLRKTDVRRPAPRWGRAS